jgi:CHASE3 domain sensor protein
MALRTEQKLPIILSVVFLTLTTFGIVFYQSTESLKQAIEADRRSNSFLGHADAVQSMCLDSQNSVRYFMFTGVDTYLDQYQQAKARIPQSLAELRRLAEGDPAVQGEIDRLDAAYSEFQSEMDRKARWTERPISAKWPATIGRSPKFTCPPIGREWRRSVRQLRP